MAEVGTVGSIIGIVDFGLKLAVALQTYVEAVAEAEERLAEITSDVSATAGALKQLHAVLESDQAAVEASKKSSSTTGGNATTPPPVFNEAGRREIEALAARCEKVYGAITVLVRKAAGLPADSSGSGSGGSGGDGGSVPAKSALNITGLGLRRRLKWPWLQPRITRCERQLRWLKITLIFHLSVASLAQFQIDRPSRTPGSFEDEQILRTFAQQLKIKQADYASMLVPIVAEAAAAGTVAIAAPPQDLAQMDTVLEEAGNIPPLQAPEHAGNIFMHTSEEPIQLNQPNLPTPVEDLVEAGQVSGAGSGVEDGLRPNHTPAVTEDGNDSNAEADKQAGLLDDAGHDDDDDDEILEAYIIDADAAAERRLHFGIDQLYHSLKRLQMSNSQSLVERFMALRPDRRQLIEQCMVIANFGVSPYRGVCSDIFVQPVAHGIGDSDIVVFLKRHKTASDLVRLADPAMARMFDVPFEQCRTWESIRDIISKTIARPDHPDDDALRAGDYDLCTGTNDTPQILLPQSWKATVCPGMGISIVRRLRQLVPATTSRMFIGQDGLDPGQPRHGGIETRRVLPGIPDGVDEPWLGHVKAQSWGEHDGGQSQMQDGEDAEADQDVEALLGAYDFEGELATTRLSLGELLGRWTNAPDPIGPEPAPLSTPSHFDR